ncbi:hypothetical protein [Paracoccus sp. S4493]|uniref:hypothetical protein n=1 Tax=Paracoccus sp. S4493 TaxID=579490 RepID=UPI000697EB9B|nr:hypothetical protein [Paracoccus sp. S4493]
MRDAVSPVNRKGIRSKDRVRDLGEVFTQPREVDAMIKLVVDGMIENGEGPGEIVHSTWLEPTCGNGNFLWAILELKARAIEQENHETPHGVDLSIRLLQAISSISAIDISPENVGEAHVRILRHAIGWHLYLTGSEPGKQWAITCYDIIKHKIVVGDFLNRCGVLHEVHVSDDGVIVIKPHDFTTLHPGIKKAPKKAKRKARNDV